MPKRILQGKLLVGEKTDGIVHKLCTHPMITLEEIEGDIGTCIHSLRIVLKSGQCIIIGNGDIDLHILSHSRRIE